MYLCVRVCVCVCNICIEHVSPSCSYVYRHADIFASKYLHANPPRTRTRDIIGGAAVQRPRRIKRHLECVRHVARRRPRQRIRIPKS